MKYLKRLIEYRLEKYLKIFGAVLVEGPRGCGKSTTCLKFSKSNILFNPLSAQNITEEKLSTFLTGTYPRLIDEWQLIPFAWDFAKNIIDKKNGKGLFIFCGSVIKEYDYKMHTGALRIGKLQMNTLTISELEKSSKEVNFNLIFNNDYVISGKKKISETEIAEIIIRGGWPSFINLSTIEINISLNSYIKSIVQQDFKQILNSPSDERIKALIISLARNISCPVSNTLLMNESIIINSNQTLQKYLDILQRIFVINYLETWKLHVRSSVQIRNSPKYYFIDPSIAAAALNIKNPETLINDKNTFGLFFENLVIKELKTYADLIDAEIYYFRDNTGFEIDCIMEFKDETWAAFEIKLGSEKGIVEGIKNLKSLKNKIEITKYMKCRGNFIITCAGKSYIKDGIKIISLNHLYFNP